MSRTIFSLDNNFLPPIIRPYQRTHRTPAAATTFAKPEAAPQATKSCCTMRPGVRRGEIGGTMKIPDQPVDPPELPPDAWERNNRNSMRLDVIRGLGTVISRLYELDYDNDVIWIFEKTQNQMYREMEG